MSLDCISRMGPFPDNKYQSCD